ncbi:MAG TPA: TonB family protein [Polyangiales bacterium]|nr:TonB family protein [Polyangiales bacterium]
MSTAWFGLSVAVHAGTFMALGLVSTDVAVEPMKTLEMDVVEQPAPPLPEPEPAAPEPEPEPVQAPPPKPVAPPKAPKAPKEPPPPQAQNTPPAAAEETIADFSGTTLTGSGGWASAVGSGAPMNGPIGSPTGVVTGRNKAGVAGGVVGGTGERVLGPGDLSRGPLPPNSDLLNAALERSYPKAARQQGIEGVARIRLRVHASGKLQPLSTLSETYPGFADACKSSLREVNFQPALDKAGQAVATDITYKCDFTVE